MIETLFCLSLVGGFFSGLLGVGGAVVLIPLMLTVPPLVGVGRLSMNQVAGLSMVQVLAASVTGCLAHRRGGFAHTKTILTIGIPMGLFSFLGAAFSRSIPDGTTFLLFGCLVTLALLLLLKPLAAALIDDSTHFKFNAVLSAVIGSGVGLVSGIVGAGGGFILIPIMLRILKIPMRVAVGSSLGIVFLGALMGSAGKILTLQVQWIYLLPVIGGSLPAVLLGAHVSKRMSAARIRHAMLFLVLVIFIKTWWGIFSGGPATL